MGNNSTRDVKIMAPLKYCEINRILTWSETCFIIHASINNEVPTFTITVTKLYVPVVSLSTQHNAKLLQQLKSCFRRTINWNKYQLIVTEQERNRYLGYLIDSKFRE